jgi:hypothetical protein
MRWEGKSYILLTSATVFFTFSFVLHFPVQGLWFYSDVVNAIWYFSGANAGGVPYIDYNLEYPALSGIVIYLSSLSRDLYLYYTIFSFIIYLCMLGSMLLLHRMGCERGIDGWRLALLTIFTPSFLVFSIYSFDWLGVVFLLLSLYLFMKGYEKGSGFALGLAGAARLIPLLCLPFLLQESRGWRRRLEIALSALLGFLIPNLYFMLANFQGFLYTYTFQAEWGVEDSWLILFPEQSHTITLILFPLFLLLILLLGRRAGLVEKCWLGVMAFVLTSYKFPPQYMILLAPLFALSYRGYTPYILADLLNVNIILWWFIPQFTLGSPLVLESPIQWIAILRQVLIAYIFLRAMKTYWKGRNSSSIPSGGHRRDFLQSQKR